MDPELGELAQLSRVELEPAMASLLGQGELERAGAIRSELGSRPWAGTNPYA